ncbi:helicase C-terminal domain-containing protein [Enterococcus timonensis]|uniref:helicase C-terminal domain-containing protein n=1 Tax=Enterococcus timonensis TaxID=1852364 RepID=UPI0008D9EDEA|nr:helicase C-terminal domain-containing protein [Enterococcus timonensis]
MEPIYAVVDLETTGTDLEHDRIIQVGAVLLQNGQIVSRFATDVNPERKIPKNIETLTGISNKQVRQAPIFTDIAGMLHQYLEGTIFVAHNIGFDYRFLNAAMQKEGLPPLKLAGIDTVVLAQIFFPTEISFRLKDLADSFGLTHERPHHADSDAEVTAQLLLKIQEKMRAMPKITLEKIAQLATVLPFQTGNFIQRIEQKQTSNQLPAELMVVENLVLRKKTLSKEQVTVQASYPKKKKDKEKILPPDFQFRNVQARMMNLVADFFMNEQEQSTYFLEAPSGIGKSVGYLFPLSFVATPEKPVVIATSTLLLQQQLLKDIDQLNQTLPKKLKPMIIKSPRHYLDLARFSKSLQTFETKQITLYQMMILVWLTETMTGDFSELNLLKISDPYFKSIASTGHKQATAFSAVDFYFWVKQQALSANVLITNHAYLLQENLRKVYALPKTPFLVIDEAHHLPNAILQQQTQHFDFDFVQRKLRYLSFIANDPPENLVMPAGNYFIELTNELATDLEALNHYFVGKYPLDYPLLWGRHFQENLEKPVAVLVDQVEQLLKDVAQWSQELLVEVEKEPTGLAQLLSTLEQVILLWPIFRQFFNAHNQHVKWLTKEEHVEDLVLNMTQVKALDLEKAAWFTRYEKVLLVGATFQIGRKKIIQEQLQLPNAKSSRLHAAYDYQKQLKFYVPEADSAVNPFDQLVLSVEQYMKEVKQPLLVLFSSHQSLANCYARIQKTALDAGRELLAQGVNGTKEKLLKRFLLSNDAIMLGNETFWEGIDLPGKNLPVIFVAKLPFENPNQPLVQVKFSTIEQAGGNAFYQEALPHCSMRLQQAIGRLLRTPEDRGVLVLFDQRMVASSYAPSLQKNLPKGLLVETIISEKLITAIESFNQKGEVHEN